MKIKLANFCGYRFEATLKNFTLFIYSKSAKRIFLRRQIKCIIHYIALCIEILLYMLVSSRHSRLIVAVNLL